MPFFISSHIEIFPHPFLANEEGFLAICNDLSPERMLMAYQFGIFPWYSEGDPVYWFFTSPRCVLRPSKVKISKSMRSYFNQNKFQVSFDTEFHKVLKHCRDIPRYGQAGTWLTNDLMQSLLKLHEMGFAHSVEVWEKNELIGGLYGLSIGKIFYGESMFTHKANASKFGFITLCKALESKGYTLIDCQQETNHLLSLGAYTIPKEEFLAILKQNSFEESQAYKWTEWANTPTTYKIIKSK